MSAEDPLREMREVRLAADQVEVRRARSKIFAGVFGGAPKATMVGRFEVRERLGAGGMGIVYEAYDPQLDRKVALKVLRADATLAPDGARRMVEEARAMAKLAHPNVITVYEAGTVDEQVFIAMALVQGHTLRTWLDAEERGERDVLQVMRAAGEGLAAAHDAGLVHRDFKPENVLVSDEGEVFVTDFGLARSFTAAESGGWRRVSVGTLTTKLAGTPAYMAPEQLRGLAVDGRCDQFAWCVTAYEALVGRRPFDEVTLQRIALEPSFTPEPIVPASISRRVRVALERGLSMNAADRYPSLAALLDAVRPPRRTWVPVSLGLGVAVAGLGTAVAMQREPCPAAPERLTGVWDDDTRAAVAEAFAASGMPYAQRALQDVQVRADRFVEQWVSLQQRSCREDDARLSACLERRGATLGAVTRLFRDADAGVVEHAAAMLSAVPTLAECTDPDAAAQAEPDGVDARLDDARVSLLAGRYDDAHALTTQVVQSVPDASPPWLQAWTLQGEVALARGDAEASTAAFERVLDRASGEYGRLSTARAAIGLLEVQGKFAKTDFEAATMLARMAKIAVASAGNPPRLRTRLESAHAGIEIAAGKFDAGIERVERARAQLAELGDDTLLERARLMQLAAKALFRKQQFDEAERLGNASMSILRDTLGPMHPEVARARLLLGSLSLVRGDPKAAELAYREAADVFAQTLGKGHADYAVALASLANSTRARGELAQARALAAEALAVMETVFPEDHMRVLAVRQNLAALEQELGNLEAARTAYLETLRVQRRTLGEHYEVAITLANLARVHVELGAFDDAEEAAREAFEIRTAVFGDDHDRTLAARLVLAEIRLGHRGSPKDVLREVTEIRTAREQALGDEHPATHEAMLLQAKAALRAGDPATALRHAEDTLRLRVQTERPAREVDAARVLVAQSASQAGNVQRARDVAASVTWSGPLASELRGWCEDCKAEMKALAEQAL